MTTPTRSPQAVAQATGTVLTSFLAALVLSATSAGAGAQPSRIEATPPAPIELPRVVITGRVQPALRAAVAELPRVVVTGQRIDASDTRFVHVGRPATPRS